MKKTPPFISRMAWYYLAIGMVAVLVLVGCGNADFSATDGQSGGGQIISGVGTGGTGVVKSSAPALITGNVNLIGAVVFLDKNSNRLPDAEEPCIFTDQDGRYTLQADADDLARYPLMLQAVAGATLQKTTGLPLDEGFVQPLPQ